MRYYNISELSHHEFYQVNKNLITALGDFLLAGVLTFLINARSNPKIIEYREENEGFFYVTIEKMQEELCINYSQQTRCLRDLATLGLVTLSNRGVPCKRHVRLEEKAIVNFINSHVESTRKPEKKAESKEQFYEELNEAIDEGAEAFAKKIDNMDKQFAEPMYVFTRALKQYHNIPFTWTSAQYGKFKNIIGYKQVDYRRLLDILKDDSFKGASNIFWNYKAISKKTLENPPTRRIPLVSQLSEWEWLRQPIKNFTTN